MPLGMEIGLGPSYIVLDWDAAPLSKKGTEPLSNFRPISNFLLWPNGWMHQHATRYGGRPKPRRVCVRWGRSRPPQKGDRAPSPILRVEVENFEIGACGCGVI